MAQDDWTDDELVDHLLRTGVALRGKKRSAKDIEDERLWLAERSRRSFVDFIGKVLFFGGTAAAVWYFRGKS